MMMTSSWCGESHLWAKVRLLVCGNTTTVVGAARLPTVSNSEGKALYMGMYSESL